MLDALMHNPSALCLAAALHDLPILNTVAFAFGAAWVLGMITHKLGLSPIVGYLLAGIAIGPHTPGFVGDPDSAAQLAEIGVILLMFGVGLHFHVKDLMAVKTIAVPGAIAQASAATFAGALAFWLLGWPFSTGVVLGIAMSVASTVVLIRVLTDAKRLDTPEGHVAVGWLIVEDIITVVILVMLPALAVTLGAEPAAVAPGASGSLGPFGPHAADTAAPAASVLAAAPPQHWASALGWALVNLTAMVVLVVLAGSRLIPWLMIFVARQRSRELFTLTVLVMSVAVAVGAAKLFGASVALGAFLAGMVVGQSSVSKQAGAEILPLRDAFAVLFFASVGMLFDPRIMVDKPLLVIAGLFVVLAVKPIIAILVVAVLGYPARTALTVAIGLGQIGEFSFIVAELARRNGLLNPDGQSVLVACAIVSISMNPVLFRNIPRFERWLQAWPMAWRVLNRQAEKRAAALRTLPRTSHEAETGAADASAHAAPTPHAIVVGYGPAGRHADRLLREAGVHTIVVDLNMDTVSALRAQGRDAIYGDGALADILQEAGIREARYLVLTMPDAASRLEIITGARALNPATRIFARARYAADQAALAQFVGAGTGPAGTGGVVCAADEIESAVALSRLVLLDLGADRDRIRTEMQKIRAGFDQAPPGTPTGH